ncbi:MAG: hypothetical protein Q4G02_03425 [bacterium]|nr:hypothetical protein [bacterium]
MAKKAASVLKNTAFGTGLGATIGAVTAKSGERLKGAKEGALSGAKSSYLLPATNAISNAAIVKVGKALPWSQLSKLSPEAIAKASEATGKLARAGQYGAATKNALKVVGKSALVEGLKSPLETAAFSLDDKLRLNTDKTFSERYKERFTGDLAGNAIFGGGGAAVGQAGSLARGMIDFNQNYKNGFVEGADGSKRTTQQYELKKALENGSSKPMKSLLKSMLLEKRMDFSQLKIKNCMSILMS